MLPLVLGGIAIAAVGYGLKEYCEEEGCPWDESEVTVTRPQNVFEVLHSKKKHYIKIHCHLTKHSYLKLNI